MTTQLTPTECTLLQRYYDGDPLEEPDVSTVEELLNGSKTARVFMSALEELTSGVQAAEQEIWDRADTPSAASVVEMAMKAARFADQSLEDLSPLLERFFDGEVMPEEMIAVQALINERDDVADYLANLETLRASVRVGNDQLVDSVSFDGFWDAVSSKIEAESADHLETVETPRDTGSFDPEEHRVLLYRYNDDEVDTAERDRVDSWIAEGDADVVATLSALSEVRMATVAAIETAQEKVDFSDFWHRVEEQIDDQVEQQGENVVSFARKQRERKPGFLGDSRSAAWVAVAAMLFVAFAAGAFKDQLLGGGERVVVEKTVVIVDSVEYEPGSSVMVNAPMKPVSSISAADSPGEEGAQVEEEPTVIWLLDSGPAASDQGDAAPAEGDDTVDEEGATDQEPKTEETSDQPI